jgi:VanZ family protein
VSHRIKRGTRPAWPGLTGERGGFRRPAIRENEVQRAISGLVIHLADRLPWLIPGLIVALPLAAVISAPLARGLRASRFVGWLLAFSVGVILASTLTPLACNCPSGLDIASRCDLVRVTPAPFTDYLGPTDAAANVLLFLPLGFAVALIPRSRRGAAILVATACLPVAIEVTQLVVTTLHRGCESADVVDNLLGLVAGLALGLVTGTVLRLRRPAAQPDG